ncbi:hypothetical protein INR49_009828 [Caranx melampygus]|nr:hypothetical protein INR49_009828 [Caranx melampygus]
MPRTPHGGPHHVHVPVQGNSLSPKFSRSLTTAPRSIRVSTVRRRAAAVSGRCIVFKIRASS